MVSVFKWSGFGTVGTIVIEIATVLTITSKMISILVCFQMAEMNLNNRHHEMVGIQFLKVGPYKMKNLH